MSEIATDNNGRVTLALLGQQQQEILRRLERIENKLGCYETQLHTDELAAQNRETRLTQAEEDIEKLEGKVNAWSWGNSIGALIAALLAGLGLSK